MIIYIYVITSPLQLGCLFGIGTLPKQIRQQKKAPKTIALYKLAVRKSTNK